MKFRGAFIGIAATFAAIGSIAACSSDDSGGGVDLTLDAGFGLPDGNVVDSSFMSPPGDGGNIPDTSMPPPMDSGSDTGMVVAQCNDGKIDLGEICDPLSSCPTDCPPPQSDKCQLRRLDNGGTCTATCTNVALQEQCLNDDGCCPTGCDSTNDSDCTAVCGNNVLEKGETCDPLKSCPTTCAQNGCQLRKVATTGGNACTAACVDDTLITKCDGVGDGCCPDKTCVNDPDCQAGVCGNGTKDPGELCDPGDKVNPCPVACPVTQCEVFKLDMGGTCQAQCLDAGPVSACVNGDGCCGANNCNHTNDNDCAAVCGNNVVETPELCDGNCPTSCQNVGCNIRTVTGTDCSRACTVTGAIITCSSGDGCCAPGCTYANDTDCPAPTCGNGMVDPGETCDPKAPSGCMCPPIIQVGVHPACIGNTGSASTCDLQCEQPIQTCDYNAKDTCCPVVNDKGGSCGVKDQDCLANKWSSMTLANPISLQSAGDCVAVTFSNIVSGGSYDFTTCAPTIQSTGDVQIMSVLPVGSTSLKTSYGTNDNCKAPTAAPFLFGWTCDSKSGKNTNACVSESPGGVIAKSATDLVVNVCAVTDNSTFTISALYNAPSAPAAKPGPIVVVK